MGDPQVRTDHPWYPGELACSTFERLFATQAGIFERVVGEKPVTDEQKALAAWLWRNTHYFHGEEGEEDLWGKGFTRGGDRRTREYWTGFFAHGFGLCGTTHSQWTAEMHALLGPGRGRGVGVRDHNSFEVFLTGGPYGSGKWAILDHDISTVVFDEKGERIASIAELQGAGKRLLDQSHAPERQRGWPIAGLHAGDGASLLAFNVAEYLAGYEGVPPIVHLRRGETFRRYLTPGLEDGQTHVFWGRNYNTLGVPGPERSLTWVNQPERLHGSTKSAAYQPGQARYGNAVFTYRPNFKNGDYKEGVVSESTEQVTLEFQSPYMIGATPPNGKPWGIYDEGGRNGLVLGGITNCMVSISLDRGKTWKSGGSLADRLDLTDMVKGRKHYLLRLHTGAEQLKESQLTITTVCQANPSTMPRLKEGGTEVTFAASQSAVVSAGPGVAAAQAHVVEGAFGTPKVALRVSSPRGELPLRLHAAAHVASGNPPDPNIKYQIEASTDGGKQWLPVLKDWSIKRHGEDPKDFWSQSMCWGALDLPKDSAGEVLVRFSNNGGRNYSRAEAHLVYRTKVQDATKVTFAWEETGKPRQVSRVIPVSQSGAEVKWTVPTGSEVATRWVEFASEPNR